MNLLENEIEYWRHLVQVSKRKGVCVLTNIRLIYQPDGAPNEVKSWTWPSITNVLFPKNDSATAFRVKTTLQGDEEVIIQLVDSGLGADKKVAEYIQAKSFITDIREGRAIKKENTPTNASTAASTTILSSSKPSASSSSSSSSKQQVIILEIRKKLIEANENIRNQYKQLVGGNILTEEDFWKSYQYLVDESLAKSLSSSKQGIPNIVWTDIVRDEDGKRKINLKGDNKELILRMFPVVRKAYESEVSNGRMAENDFWQKFFQSEYFNNGNAAPGQKALLGSMFEKYKLTTKDAIDQLTETAKAKQRFTDRSINSEIDLTATQGDNSLLEGVDGEDQVLPEKADEAKQYKDVIRRFNQESVFVMTKDKKTTKPSSSKSSTAASNTRDDYQEQIEEQPAKYVKVNLSKVQSLSKPNLKRETTKQENTEVFRIGYKRRLVPAELMKDIEEDGVLVAQEVDRNGLNAELLRERSKRLWKEEQQHLSKLENTQLTADSIRKDALPETLQQSLGEHFRGVTELLWHFYSIINRAQRTADTEDKARKLLDKLQEEHDGPLKHKKDAVNKNQFLTKAQQEHGVAVITNQLSLINRAESAMRAYLA